MNKIQFQVYPDDVNVFPGDACLLLSWQLCTVGLCSFQIWLIKEKDLISNLVGDL